MANALVVHKDKLPQSQKVLRAAQYVRMSTDYQRYSIENQAAEIAAYAQMHGLTIVCTYRDEGEERPQDQEQNGADPVDRGHPVWSHRFRSCAVYHVSRWGRFQDIDESAHYEFVCKQAGIKVAYCAEDTTVAS